MGEAEASIKEAFFGFISNGNLSHNDLTFPDPLLAASGFEESLRSRLGHMVE